MEVNLSRVVQPVNILLMRWVKDRMEQGLSRSGVNQFHCFSRRCRCVGFGDRSWPFGSTQGEREILGTLSVFESMPAIPVVH